MAFEWKDKVDGIDDATANDINAVAKGIIDNENALEAYKNDIQNEIIELDESIATVNGDLTSFKQSKGMANGIAPLDSNGKLPLSYIYGSTAKEYGVLWDGTSDVQCTRLGDAIGLVANAHLGSMDPVKNDFDNIYPWSDMIRCNLSTEGTVLAYEGDPAFKVDGTNGDVMVEIPKFYYKRIKTGKKEEIWICSLPLDGYELHPLFKDGYVEKNKTYIASYMANFNPYTSTIHSASGTESLVKTNRATYVTYAKNKGNIWNIMDISALSALQMLYLVEYADTNSQNALGQGQVLLNYSSSNTTTGATVESTSFATTPEIASKFKVGQKVDIGTRIGTSILDMPRTIVSIDIDAEIANIVLSGDIFEANAGDVIWNVPFDTGGCDELNGESGYVGTYGDGYDDVSYRGIEGIFGRLFCCLDGIDVVDYNAYVSGEQLSYTNANINGYILEFGYDENLKHIMLPISTGGSSKTYVPDQYYGNASGNRMYVSGGTFYSGLAGGIFGGSVLYAPSSSNFFIGTRLIAKV